jgi:prephenate dehydratase
VKKISFQGVKGAYSDLACHHAYPKYETLGCNSFDEAMLEVENGNVDISMIPVENSTAGRVEEIYRLLPKMDLHIIAEHYEPVKHCLLVLPNTQKSSLKTVSSHPQALAQCKNSIKKNNLTEIAKFDTAGSAKELLLMQDKTHSAIASSLSAEIYKLDILDDSFADFDDNTTRFLVLSKVHNIPIYKKNKKYITSILFEVRNIPSALYKAIGGFATNGVNVIKIESYSGYGTLEISQFHIDISGHPLENSVKNALEELSYFANSIKMIGTYKPHKLRKNL